MEIDKDYVPGESLSQRGTEILLRADAAWILPLPSGLMCIRDMEEEALRAADMPFSTPSSAGHEVQLSSKYSRITPENRAEYLRLALNYRYIMTILGPVRHEVTFDLYPLRLKEFDDQMQWVREGMARVIPVPLLSLFTGYELETMVCIDGIPPLI